MNYIRDNLSGFTTFQSLHETLNLKDDFNFLEKQIDNKIK